VRVVAGPPTPDDAEVRDALARSNLSAVPSPVLDIALEGGEVRLCDAGSMLHRTGDDRPHCEVVLRGLVRVYVTAPDGRSLTIRYCRVGAMLGAASMYHPDFAMPANVQAVTDVALLALRTRRVRETVEHHPQLAAALLTELSERAMSFASEIPAGVFTTVPQRVATHLLDLAAATQHGPELVAETGQRELAEAVGSVREVVDRALQDLRSAGVIDTARRRVTIRDPEALHDRARGDHVDQCDESR
jgi:CRP/FNR family cyclic AMP-dependent transcriptional regulator